MDSQLDLSTTSILSLFETTKEQRKSFVSGVVNAMLHGEVDPLKVHLQVKCMEKIIEALTSTDEKKNKDGLALAKKYKELVLEAAEKYGSKEFEYLNAKVKVGETGTRYDYSKCGDSELEAWQEMALVLSEKIKAREKLLQSVPVKGMLITSEETGETCMVYPPSKSSTTNVVITLK